MDEPEVAPKGSNGNYCSNTVVIGDSFLVMGIASSR